MKQILVYILLAFMMSACSPESRKPNVILIMADDMGYECLSIYGSLDYATPILDSLASNGILFTDCIAQPLCTPSRVKIMSGKYNYRNYDLFGHLQNGEYTIGNLMKDAGYKTCIAGKWQLNGIQNKDQFPDWQDYTRPTKFGFEEYCLWQLSEKGSRYADPKIEQNGKQLDLKSRAYGPDIFVNYILDFLDRNQKAPFFIYYPMVLVHAPFQPTPDSEDWKSDATRRSNDTKYFKDMVEYTDKAVGRIASKLSALNLDKNTLLIFVGDNGTLRSITTNTDHGPVRGGKGSTTDAGTHVPLIMYWPEKVKAGIVNKDMLVFSDFFATFAEICNRELETDGISFLPMLKGETYIPRETAFIHYNARPDTNPERAAQFARTKEYKLYRNGMFFHLTNDILEESPLQEGQLSKEEKQIKLVLQKELERHPEIKKQ